MDFTLITCSYNTPEITLTMLKSFSVLHSEKTKLLLMDNSTNDETHELLTRYGINCCRNSGFEHRQGVELAFEKCETKYALLVDTDIVFKKNVYDILENMEKCDLKLVGTECGDRGGLKLYTRIHPWFMFVDIGFVKEHGIKFCDIERMKLNGSGNFIEGSKETPDPNKRLYDIGSTFYEDVKSAGGSIKNFQGIESYYRHYEGSSWHRNCEISALRSVGEQTWRKYQSEIDKFKEIDISNNFLT